MLYIRLPAKMLLYFSFIGCGLFVNGDETTSPAV